MTGSDILFTTIRGPLRMAFVLVMLLADTVWGQDPHQHNHDHNEPRRAQTLYTCPMHPQILEPASGTCPICGMDLVRKKVDQAATIEQPGKDNAPKDRKIKHWVAPMDPTFIADRPGKSPMGMDLVPVYDDGGSATVVTIDPVVVQNMGVRIGRVARGPIFRHVRTIGTVDVAEDALSVVNLRYSGWIERIYVDATGTLVKKGQALFDIYSPEIVTAQEEYLLARRSAGPSSPLASSARARLSYWDIPEAAIQQIERQEEPLRHVTVRAPQTGHVLHKSVVQGARINAGTDLYRIGNLAKIWINADVYEFDAPWVRLGDRATMELTFQPGKSYEAAVAFIYPTLNMKTRTLTVRLELDNPGLALKPGMFATVVIEAQREDDVVLVPSEAILHSGAREVVFVALDLGRYEMREITTGLVGDRYVTEILSGLVPGERVVTSGQFLLDSESQLQEAVQKLLAERLHANEPRAQATSSGADDGSKPEPQQTYWTCGMHPQVVQDGPGTCPICGMDLVEKHR